MTKNGVPSLALGAGSDSRNLRLGGLPTKQFCGNIQESSQEIFESVVAG